MAVGVGVLQIVWVAKVALEAMYDVLKKLVTLEAYVMVLALAMGMMMMELKSPLLRLMIM